MVRIFPFITVTRRAFTSTLSHRRAQGFLSITLLKEVIIIGEKELSTCGENDTTANEDTAMSSSMSIRDQDGEERKRKDKRRTGGIDLVSWRPGLQAAECSETVSLTNEAQMSIHQLLVLLDHLYL